MPMRPRLLPLAVLLGALGLGAPGAHAEDPPEPPEAGWDAERFWFAEVLPPAEAWPKLAAAMRGVPYARRRTVQKARVLEYLRIWEGPRDGDVTDEDRLALYHFLVLAERHADAIARARQVLESPEAAAALRDQAAMRMAGLLTNAKVVEQLGDEGVTEMVAEVTAYLDAREDDDGASTRGNLHVALARYHAGKHDQERALAHNMRAAREDPALAARVGRSVLTGMMSAAWDLDAYPALREAAARSFDELRKIATDHLASFEATNESRQKKMAEAAVKGLAEREAPLKMLGEPAPAWTLDHAFGDLQALEDLRGRVVVLDFWATWCPWCIKSFPAIRDLLRDYEKKGLAVVGVTAHAGSVYEQRFDLDDDLKEKAEEGVRPKPAATLDRGRPARDPSIPVLPEDQYRAREKEVIARFIENHRMTWPVVMIDKAEPGPRFGLQGWPHAVVIDRRGRVRYFKVGALLRDRKEQVAHFREILDALLAEDAPSAD